MIHLFAGWSLEAIVDNLFLPVYCGAATDHVVISSRKKVSTMIITIDHDMMVNGRSLA